MLTFKQRYKPRTTREYTKSDLTVYDSAGNTALNALKVYGKSEIVEGVIKSVGEGYAVVDLGTLNWRYDTTRQWFICTQLQLLIKPTQTIRDKGNILCPIYKTYSIYDMWSESVNNAIGVSDDATLYIRNSGYTDPTAFKTAMSGVLLCYELADSSQGNTIAVKTDNGTGIDGTMATFSTGTPLYGVSDTIRDVMTWNGIAGEVTKNCASVDLGTLEWTLYKQTASYDRYISLGIDTTTKEYAATFCAKYETINPQSPIIANKIWIGAGDAKLNITTTPNEYTDASNFKNSLSGVKLVYELATPTTEPLAQAENESLASLRTFTTTTHFTNNANTDMTVNYTIRIPTV